MTFDKNNKNNDNGLWGNYDEICEFDVIYTNYPNYDNKGKSIPITKANYCLVMEKHPPDEFFPSPYLTVAFGTSQDFYLKRDTDILVELSLLKNQYQTGLYRDTRFELHKTVPLEYNKINFKCRNSATDPVTGKLDIHNEPNLLQQMPRVAAGIAKLKNK